MAGDRKHLKTILDTMKFEPNKLLNQLSGSNYRSSVIVLHFSGLLVFFFIVSLMRNVLFILNAALFFMIVIK